MLHDEKNNGASSATAHPVVARLLRAHRARFSKIAIAALGLCTLFTALWDRFGDHLAQRPVNLIAPPLGIPEYIQRCWGQYAPYFPADSYELPPATCEITQVHIVRGLV